MTQVWTMDTVRSRCDEVGDCLIWTGPVNASGYPYCCIDGKRHSLRSFVYFDLLGKPRRGGLRVATRCGNKLCLSEACLVGRSQADIIAAASAKRLALDPLFRRRLRAMPPVVKLDEGKAEAIRNSDLPGRELALVYGVSMETIRAIRAHETWVPIRLPVNSIFNLGG